MMDLNRLRLAIGPLVRRVQLLVGRGVVRRVDDGGKVQRVQTSFYKGEVHDNMERMQPYGHTSVPPEGSDALALFLGGDRSNGVIIMIGDRKYRLIHLRPGENAIYDDLGQSVHLTREGIVIKGAGLPMTITDTPRVRIEADIEATGEIKDLCDGDGRTMSAMRASYNDHVHGGSPAPTPEM